MAQSFRKLASVAYGYSLTRLALNLYLFFDEIPLTYDEKMPDQQKLDAVMMELVSGLTKGDISLEAVAALREEISRKMEAVIAFSNSFRIYEYALNRVERRFIDKYFTVDTDEKEFAAQVFGFLTEIEDAVVMHRRIQSVVGQLPVRFTRQKYYGIVHDALSVYIGSDKESLEDMMYLLRTAGMVGLSKEYREIYPEFDRLLEHFSKISFKDITADGYREACAQSGLAGERLCALSEYLQVVEQLLNDVYVIGLTREDAVRDASEEVKAFEILKDLCRLYEEGCREIPETVEDKLFELEGIQENYYEKYLRLDPAPEYRDGEDESAYKSRCVDWLLSTSLFVSLEEKENRQDDGVVERQDVEKAFEEFVSAIDPVLASCQKPIARAFMAATLSSLPIYFESLSEMQCYIENSLASCTDRAEKEACMELVTMLMESEDYALV